MTLIIRYLAFTLLLALSAHLPAVAQDFSTKPVRIIVGLVAGGATKLSTTGAPPQHGAGDPQGESSTGTRMVTVRGTRTLYVTGICFSTTRGTRTVDWTATILQTCTGTLSTCSS